MLSPPRTRLLTIAGLAVLGLLVPASPALAGDPTNPVDCTNHPNTAECTISVVTPGHRGGHSGGSNGGSGSTLPEGCRWVKAENQLPPPPGQKAGSGGWYSLVCGNEGSAFGTVPQWIGAAPQVDPAVLARQARGNLALPSPRMRANPDPAAGVLLVRVPVWLWVDPATWGTRSATATVPGVTVTATATPRSVRWEMGDGTTKTCRGPGTAWRSGSRANAASPTCGYAFQHSSAGVSGAAFTMRATVTWSVTWAGAGAGGTLPDLTTTSVQQVRVADSQSVITGGNR
jgi:hypothetical protein